MKRRAPGPELAFDALEARARLITALSATPLLTTDPSGGLVQALERFLDGAPFVRPDDREAPTTLEASTTAALDALTCSLHGETDRVLPWLGRLMSLQGLAADEVARLGAAGERLAPAWAGAWLELGERGAALGWLMPGDVALRDALDLLHPCPARDALAAWARAQGISYGRDLSRTLSAGPGLSALSLDLDEPAQLSDALAALRVPCADAPLEALAAEGAARHATALRLSFHDGGLSSVEVQALTPPDALKMVWLGLLDLDAPTLDALAAFEGAMGAAPSVVGWRAWSRGAELVLRYTLTRRRLASA